MRIYVKKDLFQGDARSVQNLQNAMDKMDGKIREVKEGIAYFEKKRKPLAKSVWLAENHQYPDSLHIKQRLREAGAALKKWDEENGPSLEVLKTELVKLEREREAHKQELAKYVAIEIEEIY